MGLVSGAVALAAPKGERLHRLAGNVFFISMIVMSTMAAYLGATIPGQQANVAGGILCFYLITTAWLTVRREDGRIGAFERFAVVVPAAIAGLTVIAGFAMMKDHGRPAGGPPSPAVLFIFAFFAALMAATDIKVIVQGGISGVPRVARHLWRMCLGFFVATGSFFLGKQQDMPEFVRGSPVLVALAFAPFAFMIFWLVRVRLTNWFKSTAAAAASQ